MAFGRLEVYFSDGRLETYMLHEDTVSVGRADGNVIALDTDTISRYHFSIIFNGEQATITDLESANGTFVDGMQLAANEPRVLGDVEEILVGSLRIIFRHVDDSPTVMMSTLDEETREMDVSASPVHINIDYKQLNVWPAASSSAELSITNISQQTRDFSINVTGLPTGWLRLTRSEIQLDGGETAYILLNVKPPRRPNTVPQHYEVTVEVAPIDEPSLAVYTYLDVEIRAYSGFGMAIGKQIDVGEPVPVFLHNQGSGTMRFTVRAKHPQNQLVFKGPTAPLELQAGQRLRIDLGVDAKSPPLIGQEETYNFMVEVQSHDASRFVAGSNAIVTIGPRIPMWAAIASAGIALSILIIGLLALTGVLSPPDPTVESLSISAEEVEQGTILTLDIDARRADTLDILLNQSIIAADISGDTTSYDVATDSVNGIVEITVIARNGSRSARASVSSTVVLPPGVRSFTVTPDPIIRNTVNTLTVSWDVAGVSFVQISGLTEFTNNLISSSTRYDPVDTLEGIGGIPSQPLELTLYAEDEDGVPLQQTLTVPLIDPQCTALSDVPVHEGPDGQYQQVATVPSGATVVVLAQDADAAWLRLQLPDNIRGWGTRDSFSCAENFDLANLRTEVNIPELPATAQPAAPTLAPPVTDPTQTPNSQ